MVDGKEKHGKLSLQCFIMNPKNVKGVHVDHINHDTLDNRKSNLRVTDAGENYRNRKKKNANNKSGYRNVFWNTNIGKWSVVVCRDYKQIHIGDFDDVNVAGQAAEEARAKYYGQYSGGN